MTLSYVRRDSCTCETWRILSYSWAVASHVIHDEAISRKFICVTWKNLRVTWLKTHRSHVTHMNDSCEFFCYWVERRWSDFEMINCDVKCAVILMCSMMTLSYVWRDSCTCVTWLLRMCDMTHSYVRRDSCTCVTWLIHMCDMTHSYVWHDSFMCATWLIHMCDMTHAHVWYDSCICATWLIHMRDIPHAYVWHVSFICVTCLIHMCSMTLSHAWHDSCMCVTCLIHMCDMTRSHVTSQLIISKSPHRASTQFEKNLH